MSHEHTTGDFCAAYGCPLIGSFGVSGKWYCACHFRAPVAAHDPITSVLIQHRNLVDRAVSARRTFAGYDLIKEIEDRLVDLTHEVGKQYSVPTAGVKGPTGAAPHFSEVQS